MRPSTEPAPSRPAPPFAGSPRSGRFGTSNDIVARAVRRHGWWLAAGALAWFSVLAMTTGDPVVAVTPTLALLVVAAALTLPLESITPALVFVMVSVNAPGGHPGSGVFHWPLNPIGTLLYKNLPFKVAIADFIIVGLAFRAGTVMLLSERSGGRGSALDRRPPKPFVQACAIGMAAIVAMEIWGIGGGGDFRNSLWQLRIPFLVPCLALAVSVSATDRGISRLRLAFLAAGVLKAFEAIIAYWGAGLNNMVDVIYVTTHSDTVLWAVCTAILFADWFEERRRSARLRLLTIFPILALAMIANNRRTVWVSIAASIFFITAVAHRPVKRELARLLTLVWPLILVYSVVGLASSSSVFKPVHMIQSVVVQDDASSSTRDIENTNLLITLRARPVVGWGFGHKYIEYVRAYDISKDFVQYRYLPHNSFLGFWAFNGLIGGSMYFLLFVVGMYYLVASRRESASPTRRAAAAWGACGVIAYLVQAWSDVGMQDWTPMICLGVGLGMGGALGRSVRLESVRARVSNRPELVDPDDLDVEPLVAEEVGAAAPFPGASLPLETSYTGQSRRHF